MIHKKKQSRMHKPHKKQMRNLKIIGVIIVIIASGFVVYQLTRPTSNTTTEHNKAVIVDQLTLSIPNPTFVNTTTNILQEAGYTVDYYKGEQVTVDFYRNLATHNYRIIILRVHSALGPKNEPPVALFTSELYTTKKYIMEQLNLQIAEVQFYSEESHDNKTYFAILPEFIRQCVNGNFNDATIIMMGCNGLTYRTTADAFVQKDAAVYISYIGPVTADYTDLVTIQLLRNLITKRMSLKAAVVNTTKTLGADPALGSLLVYWPIDKDDYVIPSVASCLIVNVNIRKRPSRINLLSPFFFFF